MSIPHTTGLSWGVCVLLGCTLLFTACQEAGRTHLIKEEARRAHLYAEQLFEKGSEHYQAAHFLYANQPFHTSKPCNYTPSTTLFFQQIDSIYWSWFHDKSLTEIQRFRSARHEPLRYQLAARYQAIEQPQEPFHIPDSCLLSSDFMAEHVRQAVWLWHHSPYASKLDFDTFSEFLLPYRTTDEDPRHQAAVIKHRMQCYMAGDSLSVNEVIEHFKTYVLSMRWLTSRVRPTTHSGPYDLLLPKFSYDCHHIATITTQLLRQLGIPAVYEFTPLWQDRPRPHYWCAVLDSAGIARPFTPPDNNLMEDWESNLQYAGKVYRRTFAAQAESPYFLAKNQEFIPALFNTPFISDQTQRYHQTVSLELPFTAQTKNKIAYLCFFDRNNKGLSPIAWGTVNARKGKVQFQQVPLNILFFPAYYEEEELIPFGKPFLLEGTDVSWLPQPHTLPEASAYQEPLLQLSATHELRCNQKPISEIRYISYEASGHKTLLLERKYPIKRHQRDLAQSFLGVTICGSHTLNGPRDTLYRFTQVPPLYLQEVPLQTQQAYRYYHVFSPRNRLFYLAHLEFLGTPNSSSSGMAATPLASLIEPLDSLHEPLVKLVGKPLGSRPEPTLAFDNDILTYVGTRYVGIEYPRPTRIKAVRFSPRNADNGVHRNDTYNLYYFQNGWQYHSSQTAQHNHLVFDQVPANTIYWLENESAGIEELPFTYESNKQRFINNYR